MEAADANAKRLHAEEGAQVHHTSNHDGAQASHSHDTEDMTVHYSKPSQTNKACYRCGAADHSEDVCRFRQAKCNNCGKKGHIARVCRSRRQNNSGQLWQGTRPWGTHTVREQEESLHAPQEQEEELPLLKLGEWSSRPIRVWRTVNNQPLQMEVDTGAAVSVISTDTKDHLFQSCPLVSTATNLTTYTGEPMDVAGKMEVEVRHGEQSGIFPLYVIQGGGPSLLGRAWLKEIRLDWKSLGMASGAIVSQVNTSSLDHQSQVDTLLAKYQEVFKEGTGEMNSFQAELYLKPGSRPNFLKARPVPFALRETIDRELDRLESAGIIEKVSHSNLAAPLVPVPKSDGKLGLCGDYKVGLNPALEEEKYQTPMITKA